ncbi:TetR/AcrR family transcriptional regulator [uncultured Maritimibacter sp.]|jgi:AcrR family transcriptional regulator|uniref:TetR/AcrR family transcriptional regulator n=1 Tax=uncultured Maritimibacter sp. TaxID=991866 RepID=UPI002633083C|nr:TetR/AcrR family transcriptional regulator [uncultured Maritimibacter sp.]
MTRPVTAPEPRKTPVQRRAVETCAAIVEAAARILEEQGAEAVNTNLIADRAGVSVGTLYQYYPDKHAILVALIRREREVLLAELRAIPHGAEDALREMIAASIRHQFVRPRLASALERIEIGFALDAEAAEMAEAIAGMSASLLARQFGALDRTDLLTAVLIARGLINAAGEGQLPEVGLAERVRNAVEGYLRALTGGA